MKNAIEQGKACTHGDPKRPHDGNLCPDCAEQYARQQVEAAFERASCKGKCIHICSFLPFGIELTIQQQVEAAYREGCGQGKMRFTQMKVKEAVEAFRELALAKHREFCGECHRAMTECEEATALRVLRWI